MRTFKHLCKILTISFAVGFVLFICIHYFIRDERNDEFLTLLPTELKNDTPYIGRNTNNLLNLTNFQYTLGNDICRKVGKELLGIFIITSYAGHDALRAAHRQAISQEKLAEMGFRRIFVLAEVPKNERFVTQQQLRSEQERFGDLLQGNFVEAYRNLSYKHIMGLRWAATECSNSKFIVKLDDDIVYDVFQLRRYMESLELQSPHIVTSSALLAGYILSAKAPIRNRANKWFVTLDEYPGKLYPAYLSGWLYITNPSTALRIVEKAQQTPFFWIDDTWVTGVLRSLLNIPMEQLNSWFSPNAEFIDCCVRHLKESNYECEYYIGPNGGDTNLLVEFLHNVEKCYYDECIKRLPAQSLNQTCVASVKSIIPDHGEPIVKVVSLR